MNNVSRAEGSKCRTNSDMPFPVRLPGRGARADKKIRLTEITVIYRKRDSQGVAKSHIFAWTRPPRVMDALR
jgi:hypothetical protein